MSDDDGKITITYGGIMDHIINWVITLWKGDPWAVGKQRRVCEVWSAGFEPPAAPLKSSPLSGLRSAELSCWAERRQSVACRYRGPHLCMAVSWHQGQSVKAVGNWGKDLRDTTGSCLATWYNCKVETLLMFVKHIGFYSKRWQMML